MRHTSISTNVRTRTRAHSHRAARIAREQERNLLRALSALDGLSAQGMGSTRAARHAR